MYPDLALLCKLQFNKIYQIQELILLIESLLIVLYFYIEIRSRVYVFNSLKRGEKKGVKI